MIILMATGSELHVAVGAATLLGGNGVKVRVVSFPSHAFFEKQTREYKDSVLPPNIANRVVIEAASPMSWYRYAGPYGLIIGLERFGVSAPYKVMAKELGFTANAVAQRVNDYLLFRKNHPNTATIEGAPEC